MAREPSEAPPRPYTPGSLLPQGRITGPMPWVIAIMMFLTVLATAAGIALDHAARTLSADVSDRVTIQIAEADGELRGRAVRRIVTLLEETEGVGNIEVVPDATLSAQLAPWLGSDMKISDIPIPALVDADLVTEEGEREERLVTLDRAVKAINEQARVEPHANYLTPLARLVGVIGILSFGAVALMAIATGAVVVLAARGAHATHRGTIDIMHMLGATDAQVVRLFQRRMMLDALFGAVIGFTVAVIVIILVGRSMAAVASDLVQSVSLPVFAWVLLPLLPLLGVAVAWLSARVTLQRALKRSL
ncbi:cell division transport system permease protein [Sphingobium xanthum]|jgi:cell division transport system permease protein|uniref:cell division protein FtsX n=1 Tax=Sphingobium xanthum TaxID=1387165 RepID=UPI001C8B90AE|nr:FtsX-like permease family protein [Sphingobium xanthum]